jgi:hypothetical protein
VDKRDGAVTRRPFPFNQGSGSARGLRAWEKQVTAAEKSSGDCAWKGKPIDEKPDRMGSFRRLLRQIESTRPMRRWLRIGFLCSGVPNGLRRTAVPPSAKTAVLTATEIPK